MQKNSIKDAREQRIRSGEKCVNKGWKETFRRRGFFIHHFPIVIFQFGSSEK